MFKQSLLAKYSALQNWFFTSRSAHILLALVILIPAHTVLAQIPKTTAPPAVRWFPIYARFSPDASWVVVNLCSWYNPTYCRLVRWERNGSPQSLEGGGETTGHWSLIAGQDNDKSYIWPAVSWNGKKLAYVVAQCSEKKITTEVAHPLQKLDCAFYNGQPAISESAFDLQQGQQKAPVSSAARPTWRPDDKAILYWRTIGKFTLSSGRSSAQRDVYEYDFAHQKETPKFDHIATNIRWHNEFSGPFYARDGKFFSICGFGDRLYRATDFPNQDTLYGCVEVDSENPISYRAMSRVDRPDYFTVAFAEWRSNYWLVEQRSELVLRDKKTGALSSPILSRIKDATVTSNYSPVAADISEAGDVVVTNRLLTRGMTPVPWSSYYYEAVRDAAPAPIFSYYELLSGRLTPVYWPNVESLQ